MAVLMESPELVEILMSNPMEILMRNPMEILMRGMMRKLMEILMRKLMEILMRKLMETLMVPAVTTSPPQIAIYLGKSFPVEALMIFNSLLWRMERLLKK